jgi:hypothetical protein
MEKKKKAKKKKKKKKKKKRKKNERDGKRQRHAQSLFLPAFVSSRILCVCFPHIYLRHPNHYTTLFFPSLPPSLPRPQAQSDALTPARLDFLTAPPPSPNKQAYLLLQPSL